MGTPTAAQPTMTELLELLAAVGAAQGQDFAAAAARHGLTSMQAKVLAQLDGPLSMHALAERLACDASNVTGIVDRLQAHGFVLREPSPTDRRVKNVVRTERGRETILHVHQEMRATHAALDSLDETEQAALYALLERLRPIMEYPADDR
ncbi:MarR family winged helix-turn-helix transcriptional regulator [Actinacidiphila sp. bgisy167]|uniref:MarR family winged helix-turn-helix transcriptional regulator n=1 Tax=Actinacidiphila sp. bgisy167 TaxID=3413797 RepID=UPI003D7204EE